MLKDVGLDLLASKKLMMALLAMLAAAAARIGLHFTATEALAFVSPLLAAIGAQGYADGGKSAAQINERTALHQLAAARSRATTSPEVHAQMAIAKTPENSGAVGYQALMSPTTAEPTPAQPATGMRVASGASVLALAALMMFGAHAGCGATATSAGKAVATGGKAWLACEKADLGKIVDGNDNSLLTVVGIDLLASNYADLIETLIAKFGNDTIGCAVLAIEAVAKAQKPPANAMPTPLEIRASEMIQKYGWRPAPATAISTTPKP